jgi:hypothetical protein
MANPASSRDSDSADELIRELVLIVRAQRRLLDHELTRRRAFLMLSMVFALAGLLFVALGEPAVGVTAFAGATASGSATVRHGRRRD